MSLTTVRLFGYLGVSVLTMIMVGCSGSDEEAAFLNTRVEDGVVILGSDPVIDDAYKVQKEVKFLTKDNTMRPKTDGGPLLDTPYGNNVSNSASLEGDYTDSSTSKSKLRENITDLNAKLTANLDFNSQGNINNGKVSKQYLQRLMDAYAADMYKSASPKELKSLYTHVVDALQGKSDTQASLADFYLDGFNKESYEQLAVSWHIIAANNGSTYSKYMLSVLYQLGVGLLQDLAESEKWYQKASQATDSTVAKIRVAKRFLSPTSLIHDPKQAFAWMTSAAEQGNNEAQYLLGDMYLQGKGVNKSEMEAITWYGKAAEQNSAYAQYSLGVMYYNGQGTEQNLQEAHKWLENAALQGHSEAQYLLGRMYEQGFGVEKNLSKAYAWWKLIPSENIVVDNFNNKVSDLIAAMSSSERTEAEKLVAEYKNKVKIG
jgi:TPR repeat protein